MQWPRWGPAPLNSKGAGAGVAPEWGAVPGTVASGMGGTETGTCLRHCWGHGSCLEANRLLLPWVRGWVGLAPGGNHGPPFPQEAPAFVAGKAGCYRLEGSGRSCHSLKFPHLASGRAGSQSQVWRRPNLSFFKQTELSIKKSFSRVPVGNQAFSNLCGGKTFWKATWQIFKGLHAQ